MNKGKYKAVGTEGTLFPLEEQRSERKKRAYPYRSLNPKKKGGSTNSLWCARVERLSKKYFTVPSDFRIFAKSNQCPQ